MRRRLLGLALVLVSTILTPGCFFCRPWGWHHRCCASPVSGAPMPPDVPAAGWPQAVVARP